MDGLELAPFADYNGKALANPKNQKNPNISPPRLPILS
jgi:hypothetical protein